MPTCLAIGPYEPGRADFGTLLAPSGIVQTLLGPGDGGRRVPPRPAGEHLLPPYWPEQVRDVSPHGAGTDFLQLEGFQPHLTQGGVGNREDSNKEPLLPVWLPPHLLK